MHIFQENGELSHSKSLLKIFLSLSCIFLLVLILFFAIAFQNKIKEGRYIGQEISAKNTITVTETGEIFQAPDIVVINLSVTSQASSVESVLQNNTKKINEVISFIKGQGVEDKDLKTTQFNIYPNYEFRRTEVCLFPPCPGETRVLVGYEAFQTIEIKIRDMQKIGSLIQGATERGINQIGELNFTIDNKEELKKQAREQAIDKAKNKAKELASQLGVKLGRITSFTENTDTPFPPSFLKEASLDLGVGGGAQIEGGESRITVQVNVTYEII